MTPSRPVANNPIAAGNGTGATSAVPSRLKPADARSYTWVHDKLNAPVRGS
jgi:hypothetical protein